jgi:hypothetical protein
VGWRGGKVTRDHGATYPNVDAGARADVQQNGLGDGDSSGWMNGDAEVLERLKMRVI